MKIWPRRALMGALAVLLVGCSALSPSPAPDTDPSGPADSLAAFVDRWEGGQLSQAAQQTTAPAAAAQLIATVTNDLDATDLTIDTGPVDRVDADHASVTATMTWSLPVVGTWSYQVPWQWERRGGGSGSGASWLLDFSPAVIHPELGAQQTIAVRGEPAIDGPIVGRNDVQLLTPTLVHSVVVVVNKLGDIDALSRQLAALLHPIDESITATSISAGLATARAAGHTSYTVINLRDSDFQGIGRQLRALPAVSVPSRTTPLPPTPGFARKVLETAIPVAKKLAQGTPGWRIVTVDTTGNELTTLVSQPAQPGDKVTLTLDRTVEEAAEAAIDPIDHPAVLVAIQPSTGEILAVAQNAAADAQGPIALTGQYPPGSTFKIVTATAAIEAGEITPDTKVACPGAWTVTRGHTIHNEGFALGTVTATTAFAHSCNTTFAKLGAELPAGTLATAATDYGIGLDFTIPGITTLTGAVQPTGAYLSRAQNAFGQGTDLVTPFSEALMAATAATTAMPIPTLIRGTTTTVDRSAPSRSPEAIAGVRTMMRAVVTDGTARSLGDVGDVHAKTGTAEYVTADGNIQAHAWTVGFRDDLAFAALIVDGNSSRKTNDVLETFLTALPGAS